MAKSKKYKTTGMADVAIYNIPIGVVNELLETIRLTITDAERPDVEIDVTVHTVTVVEG